MKSKTLCPYPFMHQYITSTGTTSPCCHAYDKGKHAKQWESLDFTAGIRTSLHKKMRKLMMYNRWPPICEKCKVQELNGERSHRQVALHRFGFPETKKIRFLDIAFTNTCNLACRMCKPSDSSLLHELYSYIGDKPSWIDSEPGFEWKFVPERKVNYVKKLISEGLELLKVTGGEPFACKYFLEVVNWAIENDYAKNLSIDLTTNGTKVNKVLIEKLLKFKHVKLLFSLDGCGKVYDYIRHHSDWNKVYSNLTQVAKNPKIEVMASCVIMFHNTTNLKDLVLECAKIGVSVYPDLYIKPKDTEITPYHIDNDIANILKSHAEELTELSKDYENNPIQYHMRQTAQVLYSIIAHKRPNEKLRQKLKHTIELQDKLYNTNYEDYLLPEQIEYLKGI